MAKDIKISISDEEIKVYVNGEVFTSDESDEHEDETTTYSFDNAVDFMIKNGNGEDFINAVKYSKSHNNKFPASIKELANVINADDCYCTALINLTRHLGEEIENRTFVLLKNALETATAEDFVNFFNALKVINS